MTKLTLPVGAAGQKNRGWITGSGRHSGIDYGSTPGGNGGGK